MKKVVKTYMESPLYLTMPLRVRLELVKRPKGTHYDTNLREDLLHWVKTGRLASMARYKNHQHD